MTPEEQRTLNLFELVESSPHLNQRQLAQELGISLGLTNAYLHKVLGKGWVRARQVKARRWLYFLTPQGALEKSRLSLNYLHRTLDSFRELRRKADAMLAELAEEGVTGVHLFGDGDWADIVQLCLQGHDIRCLSVVKDPEFDESSGSNVNSTIFHQIRPDERILITSLENRESIIRELRSRSLEPKRHWQVLA